MKVSFEVTPSHTTIIVESDGAAPGRLDLPNGRPTPNSELIKRERRDAIAGLLLASLDAAANVAHAAKRGT